MYPTTELNVYKEYQNVYKEYIHNGNTFLGSLTHTT